MKATWERLTHLRIASIALASLSSMGVTGCSTTNSNFCTESVIVPPAKLGTCNPTQMGYPVTDAGLVILSFPDLAACEQGNATSCSSEDQKVISNTISCENGQISHAPNCESGQELTWVNSYVSMPCSGNGSPSAACSQAVGLSPP